MVTLHTGMIDDKNTQNIQKDTPDLHKTPNTLTKRSQQTHNADNTVHRRHTMRIKYTQDNKTFYKRTTISIVTLLKKLQLRKRENIYRLLQCLHFTGSKYLGTKLATSTR